MALITVSAITPISRSDMDRYGHFWNFTIASIKKLFDKDCLKTKIVQYGNSKVSCALIQGMSFVELSKSELEFTDDDYPVLICCVVKREK